MSADGIALTIGDGIARITLDRADAGNAISLPMARALLAAAIRCESDPAARCIMITGAGRLFCAGGDVQLLAGAGGRRGEVLSELIAIFHAAVQRLARASKPLVTLVNGPAAGAGFTSLCWVMSSPARGRRISPRPMARSASRPMAAAAS